MTQRERLTAFRRERDTVIEFCAGLTAAEWVAPSKADGWRVRDVVAHLGAECHLIFATDAVKVLRTKDIERFNDELAARRAEWEVHQVLDEFTVWSGRVATAMGVLSQWPLGRIPIPFGNLGVFPASVVPAMLTFDFHTHLRHDIAPVLDRPIPETDAGRMTAIRDWLLLLLEKFGSGQRLWFDQPIGLVLTGPGGGSWRLVPHGQGRLRAVAGTAERTAAQISGPAIDFPAWSSIRTAWRDSGLTIEGDTAYAERFLDTVNLI